MPSANYFPLTVLSFKEKNVTVAIAMLKPVVSLAIWTMLIWLNRIVNIIQEEQNNSSTLYFAVFFVISGLILAIVGYLWSEAKLSTEFLASIIYIISFLGCSRWIYRTFIVLQQDYSAGFKTIHIILALITVALSSWASIKITKTMRAEKKLKVQTDSKQT